MLPAAWLRPPREDAVEREVELEHVDRGIARDRVVALIHANSSRPLLGLGGERSVNVLELNLALDREQNR